jgi:polysaccharide biosynthesis protein PslH
MVSVTQRSEARPSGSGLSAFVGELMTRPKLLVLTHRLPFPLNRGDRIRAYHSLKCLSEHCDITLGSVADEPWDDAHVAKLKDVCSSVSIHALPRFGRWLRAGLGIATGRSATEGAFYSLSLARQVQEWTTKQEFDAALVYCSSMGQYCQNFVKRPKLVLLDLVDVDSEKWKQYAELSTGWRKMPYQREAKGVKALESQLIQKSDFVTVVTEDEARLFRQIHEGKIAQVISNGVDHEYFSPDSHSPEEKQLFRRGKPQFVFVGGLDYRPNVQGVVWFCQEILPEIRRQYPNALLSLVGRNPSPPIVDLAKQPGVNLVGQVDDVRPYVLAADIAVAPLKIARGVQNKVLEAMSCGLPVIASPCAAEGIQHSGGLLVADFQEQWLSHIQRLQDQQTYQLESSCARQSILDHYSWPRRLEPMLELLQLRRSSSQPTSQTKDCSTPKSETRFHESHR